MLKWAFNGARQSYLPPNVKEAGCENIENTDLPLSLTYRQGLKRKSSEILVQRRKLRWNDRESLMTTTSTPLQAHNCRSTNENILNHVEHISPLPNTNPLHNISNILLENFDVFPEPKTPEHKLYMPRQYSSTLPTFDAEYSPNGLIPGPILAMRGLGVPDSYFDKPRYLTQDDLRAQLTKRNVSATDGNSNTVKLDCEKEFSATRNLYKKLRRSSTKLKFIENLQTEDETSLSSSKMGDMTLERMIDAILESTRKERKFPRYTHLRTAPPTMSPTYTAAEDPASDLNEYWDQASSQYLPTQQNTQKASSSFNEREVRSSPSLVERLRNTSQHNNSNNLSYQLRRQRAVRHKRKLGKINKTVRSSTHKLSLSIAMSSAENRRTCRKPSTPLPLPPTPIPIAATPQPHSNISPDSGTSDLDEFAEEENTLAVAANDNGVLANFDATKRRLSFSQNQNTSQ